MRLWTYRSLIIITHNARSPFRFISAHARTAGAFLCHKNYIRKNLNISRYKQACESSLQLFTSSENQTRLRRQYDKKMSALTMATARHTSQLISQNPAPSVKSCARHSVARTRKPLRYLRIDILIRETSARGASTRRRKNRTRVLPAISFIYIYGAFVAGRGRVAN